MKRGEIWTVDLEPGFGREIHKRRPALIISSNSLHKSPHTIIIPASSIIPKVIGVEMVLVGKTEGLNKKSVLLPIFIRSVDQTRLVRKIGGALKLLLAL
jgi:mRNA interferase MazF